MSVAQGTAARLHVRCLCIVPLPGSACKVVTQSSPSLSWAAAFTPSITVLTPYDQHRAGSVSGALLADRAEKQTHEAAVSARADDEEICVLGRVEENVCGRTLPGDLLDFHLVALARDI